MRLRDPKVGTVIRVGEAQAARYLARGWVDANSAPKAAEPPAPKRRGRPPKTEK